ncbi:hypothetical protein [Treponema sp. OMZ 790]|uniref:hypothetical protein n=1 Tax=Treponema sp. OMZ 790 TaxID=2563665 RepID=UPI0020A2AA7F|nr:hypothetical protein [Treponema sp. OMZ 790]
MKNKHISFFINLLLALFGAILFALSHPNYLCLNGFSFLAYIALIPFFLLIKRTRLKFFIFGEHFRELFHILFLIFG